MPDEASGTKTSQIAFLVALLAIFGLASCGGGGGGGTPAAAAPATPAAPAILTLTDSHSIPNGTTTTIGWSSSDASQCVLYNTTATSGTISTPTTPVVASGTASSYTTPALNTNTTYTLECSGATGTSPTQQTTTVTVVPLSVYAYLTATPSAITIGTGQQYATLSWSSINSTSCSLTGVASPGTVGTSNTSNFTVAGTYSYTFSCSGAAGTNPAQQTATVTVSAASVPTITLTATPPTISNNTTTYMAWSSTNTTGATPCTATGTGAPGGPLAASGSFTTPNLTVNPTTYTISCTGLGGTATQSATVTVNPPASPPAVTVTASPSTISSGESSTISWTSTNATSCSSAGGGGTGTTGAFTTPALTAPSTTYTVTCTGLGGSISGNATVTVSGGACATTGDTGAITLSSVAARLNGVAPLAVFFDASGTTAPAITRPFHELEYRWTFGDASGTINNVTTWGTGSNPGVNSRNTATGPVAAHVFERPGTYTATLYITDGTNAVQNGCTTIVVQDPDVVFSGANTYCVGATALPVAGAGGCPAGATPAMQPNFTTAISSYARTGKRVLFKRGDTFTISTAGASITATGPGIVGAFGSGNLPLVQVPLNDRGIFSFSSGPTPAFKDWRLMDLEFDGMGGSNVTGVGNGGGATQITLLRLTMRRFEAAIGIADGNPNYWNNYAIANNRPELGGHTVDQIAVVDSTVVYGPNTHYGGYNAGNRFAFMGNSIDNGGLNISRGDPINGSHVARFPYLGKAVISNNDILRPGFDRLGIKIHAPTWSYNGSWVVPRPDSPTPTADQSWWSSYSAALSGDGYSKQIIISDNKLVDFINPWSIAVGPQGANADERVRDVIMERNLHVGTPTSQMSQIIRAQEVTARNNLFLGGGSTTRYAFRVEVDGPEPPASNVCI
ncbi:MAG: hypothetical protein HY846_07145 [Nitrosomonadales bacterium]|nr:hypothetical protein [Nitrosomonadales bacterium]